MVMIDDRVTGVGVRNRLPIPCYPHRYVSALSREHLAGHVGRVTCWQHKPVSSHERFEKSR